MANVFGRQVVLPLTNQSGGSVAAGDVVIIDTAHNDSFTTTTSAAYTGGIGVAQATIGSGSVGLVLMSGYAALVNVNASVTRGNYLKTHSVVKQGTDAGSSRASGTCGVFLTGGTTPDAMIWQPDLGGGSGIATGLLAAMQYAAATVYSTSSATIADIDASNILITFTAPASGNVMVHISGLWDTNGGTGGQFLHVGLRESSSQVGLYAVVLRAPDTVGSRRTAEIYVTGVSAGSHTYKAAWAMDQSSSATARLQVGIGTGTGAQNGPVTMEVWSAP